MPKSPLSAPGGSNGRNNYDWNSRDRRRGYNGSGGGYSNIQNDNYESCTPKKNEQSPHLNDDGFIPLGYSSPVNHHPRHSGNWRGSGNGQRRRGSPMGAGYNSYGNNSYHDTPNSRFNNSNSPKHFYKQNYGQRRPHQKDAHRHVDISNYVNAAAFLEDPWAKLVKKLESSQTPQCAQPTEAANSEEPSQPLSQLEIAKSVEISNSNASGSSCGSILIGDLNVKSNSPTNPESDSLDNLQTPVIEASESATS